MDELFLIVIGCAILLLFFLLRLLLFPRRSNGWTSHVKDGVVVYQIGKGKGAPSVSPFPLKLETFLRMAKIPYVNDHTGKFSSKGKTPWMEHNGVAVADSQFCIEYLKEKLNVDLNTHLNPSELAQARAFQKMVEENMYWTMCAVTFGSDLTALEKVLPYAGLKLWVVTRFLRWTIQGEMRGHGIGRHTEKEIWSIGRADLMALSDFLGSKPFLMGVQPSEVDCAVFGMLSQIRWHMPGSPHEKLLICESCSLLGSPNTARITKYCRAKHIL